MKQNSRVLDVTLNLIGTIIGAGVFGLPAVMAKTGVLGGTLIFFGIMAVALLLHLLFAQIVLVDKTKRRLAGYAGKWVGGWAYWLALIIFFFKCCGAILAYIILGGEFISAIAHGLGLFDVVWVWQLVFWAVGAIIVFFGLKIVTHVEDDLTWLLVGAMIFSGVVLVPFFDWHGLSTLNAMNFWQALGVMFFAVTAMTVVPEAVDIAGRNANTARRGIIWGTVIAGVISWIFGLSIALAYPGVQGAADISQAFPPIFWWLIPTVGVLAVVTSYLTVTQALKNLLLLDVGFKPILSWAVAIVVPLGFFAITARNFLNTIGFVGGVLTGLSGLIVCLCAWQVMRHKGVHVNWAWKWLPLPLGLVLLAIVLQELMTYVKI
ncbi:MAG: aromatic amino acid transport family protein [Patescibacteria group bacterium]|nr:aromatic amino acid transport family protein [Patescibacteria group bacterium]